jgi:predicted RNA-binding protein with PUA-like domain
VLLETLKNKPLAALNEMLILRRGNRLSVTPITAAEWKAVLSLEAKGSKAKR